MLLTKKDEKMTTNFEAVNDEDGINKGYVDEKLFKIDGHLLFFFNKNYNEFKLQYDKQSVEKILIHRVVIATIQILYKNFFEHFQNADKVLKDFFLPSRRRPDLSDEVNDDIQ